ncbi:unnamed protein product, partial [Pocillopora meandrina]
SAHPAFSCKEILDSGHSKGDGEYWIDPEKSGNPLRVYCDMSRYANSMKRIFRRLTVYYCSVIPWKITAILPFTVVCFILGGWLLVSNVECGSLSPKVSVETSYRGIGKSHMVLQKSAMKELRGHLSFIQMRFNCRKKQGRTFHVVTAFNSSGEAMVQYFSGRTDEQPDACVSFVRWTLDDNSKLASICQDWGLANGKYYVGKWGHGGDQKSLYSFPTF